MMRGDPKVVICPKVPLVMLHRRAVPVGVIQDVEEVRAEIELGPLVQVELAAERHVPVVSAGFDDRIAARVAESSRRLPHERRPD